LATTRDHLTPPPAAQRLAFPGLSGTSADEAAAAAAAANSAAEEAMRVEAHSRQLEEQALAAQARAALSDHNSNEVE
jgi:hypothetical protein